MKQISTLHVLPGPIYDSKSVLEKKYEGLSEFSRGGIVSLGPKNFETHFGNYRIALIGTNERYNNRANLRLFVAAIREAKKLNAQSKLDIVICYDPLKTGLISYIIKLIFRCKMIVEVNGIYDSPALYKFKKGWRIKAKRFIYPKIQNFILRKSDGIKCLFEGQINRNYPHGNQIVRSFFDYTKIEKSNYFVNKVPTILSMGFPSYIKGMDLLIKAFNTLTNQYPTWQLIIVGHFTNLEKENLSALSEKNTNISIRKPIAFTEVPRLIDQCDIFVLASRTEAMGRVLIEAMARGRARIATNVGGISTVIKDDSDGLLVEPENVLELSKKLEQLIDNEPYRKKLAEAGLSRFESEFTIKQYALHVKNFYQDVCLT